MAEKAVAESTALYPAQDRDAGLTATKRPDGSRATTYDPMVGVRIVELISEGFTLKAICETPGFPTRATFYRWLVNTPELAKSYAMAREISAHSMEEEALELGRLIVRSPESAQKVRAYDVLMNQLRWSASKRNPRVYSERGSMILTVPIQINTSLNLAQEGAPPEQSQGPDSIYQIEARVEQPVQVDPDQDPLTDTEKPIWKPRSPQSKQSRQRQMKKR